MNSATRSSRAYGAANTKAAPNSSVESWALMEAARRMAASQQAADDREGLLAAVRLNWRLWTILQVDVASQDNPLPEEVKSNLLSLANFIDKHTVSLLADPDPAKIDILVSINRNIAGGLLDSQSRPAAGENDAADAPPPTAEGETVRRSAVTV